MKKGAQVSENIIKTKIIADQLPKCIDFGPCPVSVPALKVFNLKNFDSQKCHFSFSKGPFIFTPEKGSISPDQVIQIQISCNETTAKILISKSIFTVNDKKSIIKLSAIFKYPHLIIKNTVLDFEELIIGSEKIMQLELFNPTDIPVNFQIVSNPAEKFEDKSITCGIREGTVLQNESFLVSFKYRPFIAEFKSYSSFFVKWMNNIGKEIQVNGFSKRLFGKLNTSVLNFGYVKINTNRDQELILYNCVPSEIQFEVKSNNSVFSFSKRTGKITGLSYVRLICRFNPNQEGAYFEKGFCFIKNQDLISFDMCAFAFDMVNSANEFAILMNNQDVFAQQSKTNLPFGQKTYYIGDISSMKSKENQKSLRDLVQNTRNLSIGRQDQNKTMFRLNSIKEMPKVIKYGDSNNTDKNVRKIDFPEVKPFSQTDIGFLKSTESEKKLPYLIQKSCDLSILDKIISNQKNVKKNDCQILSFENFSHFFENSLQQENIFEINVEKGNYINFKECSSGAVSRTIEILNLDQSRSLIFLFTSNCRAFSLEKSKIILAPMERKELQITLTPKDINHFYVGEILCVISSFITDSLVIKKKLPFNTLTRQKDETENDLSDLKPKKAQFMIFQAKITLAGHTFADPTKTVIPIVKFSPDLNIYFQTLLCNEEAFQSISIENKSNSNCFFSILRTGTHFSVYPRFGLLHPKQVQNIFIRFSTKKEGIFIENLEVVLNLNYRHTIKMHAYCTTSSLYIENNGELFITPNYCGVTTETPMIFRNTGRNEMNVSIKVPTDYNECLQIIPNKFLLPEKKSQTVFFHFTPLAKEKYVIYCNAMASFKNHMLSEQLISVFSEGNDGKIYMNPSHVDFGTVMVNHRQVKKILIHNLSNCNFFVQLLLELNDMAGQSFENQTKICLENSFELDFVEGIISGNITKEVTISFTPREICAFSLKLSLIVKPNKEKYIHQGEMAIHQNSKKNLLISSTTKLKSDCSLSNLQKNNANNEKQAPKMNNMIKKKSRFVGNKDKTPQNEKSTELLQVIKVNPVNKQSIKDQQTVLNIVKEVNLQQHSHNLIGGSMNSDGTNFNFKIKPIIKDVCKISAKANYPLLKINNVQSNELSVVYIWDKFQITQINRELSKNLSAFELKNAKMVNKLFDQKLDPNSSDRCFEWDFGYVHNQKITTRPRIVKINIQNVGGTQLEWKFHDSTRFFQLEHEELKIEKEDKNMPSEKEKLLPNKEDKNMLYEKEKLLPNKSNFSFSPLFDKKFGIFEAF